MIRKAPYTTSLRPERKSLFPRATRKELILYVEDNEENWHVAEMRLGADYELVRAETDADACRIIRERGQEIAVVLMDIELRGSTLSGAELTEIIRGNPLPAGKTLPAYARGLPTISKPVIFVTAHCARYTDIQLMLFGADKVITKPINFGLLQNTLISLLAARTSPVR